MQTEQIKNLLIEAGAVKWEKEGHERIYIKTNEQLENIGATITDTPKYAGETRGISSNSKTYFDVKKGIFFAETGSLKNTFQELGFKAVKV
jgi:hypothetical protein